MSVQFQVKFEVSYIGRSYQNLENQVITYSHIGLHIHLTSWKPSEGKIGFMLESSTPKQYMTEFEFISLSHLIIEEWIKLQKYRPEYSNITYCYCTAYEIEGIFKGLYDAVNKNHDYFKNVDLDIKLTKSDPLYKGIFKFDSNLDKECAMMLLSVYRYRIDGIPKWGKDVSKSTKEFSSSLRKGLETFKANLERKHDRRKYENKLLKKLEDILNMKNPNQLFGSTNLYDELFKKVEEKWKDGLNSHDELTLVNEMIQNLTKETSKRDKGTTDLLINFFNSYQFGERISTVKWHNKGGFSPVALNVSGFFTNFFLNFAGVENLKQALTLVGIIINRIEEKQQVGIEILGEVIEKLLGIWKNSGMTIGLREINFKFESTSESLNKVNATILAQFFEADPTKTLDDFCAFFTESFGHTRQDSRKVFIEWLDRVLKSGVDLSLNASKVILEYASRYDIFDENYLRTLQGQMIKNKEKEETRSKFDYLAVVIENLLINGKSVSSEYIGMLQTQLFSFQEPITFANFEEKFINYQTLKNNLLTHYKKCFESRDKIFNSLSHFLSQKPSSQNLSSESDLEEQIYRYYEKLVILFLSSSESNSTIKEESRTLVDLFQSIKDKTIPFKEIILLSGLSSQSNSKEGIQENQDLKLKNLKNFLENISMKLNKWGNLANELDNLIDMIITSRQQAKNLKNHINSTDLKGFDKVVDLEAFTKVLDDLLADNIHRPAKDVNLAFQNLLNSDSKSLDIYKKRIFDNQLVYELMVAIIKKVSHDNSETDDRRRAIIEFGYHMIDEILPDLNDTSSYTDGRDLIFDIVSVKKLSVQDFSCVQLAAIRVFEGLIEQLATQKIRSKFAKLVCNLTTVRKFTKNDVFGNDFTQFASAACKEHLKKLQESPVKQKYELVLKLKSNYKHIDDFIKLCKMINTNFKDKTFKVLDNDPNKLKSILSGISREEDYEFSDDFLCMMDDFDYLASRGGLNNSLVSSIMALEDIFQDFKEVANISRFREHFSQVNERQSVKKLDDDTLKVLELIISSLKGPKDVAEVFTKLRNACTNKDGERVNINQKLVEKRRDIKNAKKDYMAMQRGEEQNQKYEISDILECSTIYFYQRSNFEPFELLVAIKDVEKQGDGNQRETVTSKDYSIDEVRKKLSDSKKLSNKPFNDSSSAINFPQNNQESTILDKRSELKQHEKYTISEDRFRSLQMKAAALSLSSADKKGDMSHFDIFHDMATKTLACLETLSRLSVNHEVYHMAMALTKLDIASKSLKKQGKQESMLITEIRNQKFETIESLYNKIDELKSQCKQAKEKVFCQEILKYYRWSSFQTKQLCLIIKYLTNFEGNSNHQDKTDKRVALLFKQSNIPMEVESIKRNLQKVSFTYSNRITYSELDNLNTVFDFSFCFSDVSNALSITSKTDQQTFRAVVYDQGERITTHKNICIVDSGVLVKGILFCNPYTTDQDIDNFLLQSTNDPLRRKYVMTDIHLLTIPLRNKLLSELANSVHRDGINTNTNITLVVPRDHKSGISKEINDRYKEYFKIDVDRCMEHDVVLKQESKTVLVTSDSAGLGKTHYIEQAAKKANLELLVLNLSGTMTPEVLNARLRPLFNRLTDDTKNQTDLALRIKVDLTEGVENNFDYLDQLLFKICMLNKIEFEDTYLGFESMAAFYIELQNTLDCRLFNVEFIDYLRRDPSVKKQKRRVNIEPPFKTIDEVDPDDESSRRKFDYRLLFKQGLADCLLLWFLLNNQVNDGGDPLISYINPNQLKFIGLKSVLEGIMKTRIKSASDSERKSLKKLESMVKEGQIDAAMRRRHKDLFNDAADLENTLIRRFNNFQKSYSPIKRNQTRYKTLVTLTFNRRELNSERSGNEAVIQEASKITSHEAWLMLLIEVRNDFNADMEELLTIIEEGRLDSFRHEDGGIREALEGLFKQSGDDEDDDYQIGDLNYYHVQTMIKLTQQFVKQFDKASNLDVSIFISKDSLASEMDGHVRLTVDFRRHLAEKMIKQNRSFAFEQILPMGTIQRKYHSHMTSGKITADERDNFAYYQAIDKLKHHKQIQSDCYFLKDGVLKNIYNGTSKEEGTISKYLNSQMVRKLDLTKLSQADYIQEIYEAMTEDFKSDESTPVKQKTEEMEEQKDSKGGQQEKKKKFSAKELLEEINKKDKRFLITPDNYLKMRLILERAEVGIPSILLGESGCGKTFLIEFISEILFKDFLIMKTFHSGVSESELSDLIKECIEKAQKNPNKRVWLFLDEINTTPLLTQIAELITERTMYFSDMVNQKLPDKIVIVAACNPYKIRNSKESCNLASDIPQNDLLHKVYPLPENLISYCFNYGQLSDEDEKAMICEIIKDSDNPILTSRIRSLSNCLSLAQRELRRIENNDSAASLRDIRRFVNLFKSFDSRKLWSGDECLMLTFHCCYCIRLEILQPNNDEKTKLSEFAAKLQSEFFSMDEMGRLFKKASTNLLDEAKKLKCIKVDIAINKPLRENVFIMLHCFLGRIPVFLCGRPGTSKSVAVLVIEKIFNMKQDTKNETVYFKGLPTATMIPIWGSVDTEAKHVEDEFIKVKNNAEENKSAKNHIYIIYFEEMGIADMNKNNPLKVLHALLEPRIKDIVKNLCFVGLSNSLPDAAKLSRMLMVPRKEMEDEDLLETIKTYQIDQQIIERHTESSYKEMKFKKSISEALVQSYIRFRNKERSSREHPNFHGPRDFYSMCKWINQHMPSALFKDSSNFISLKEKVLWLLCLAIEKNFSGRELRQEGGAGNQPFLRNCSYDFKLELFSLLTNNPNAYTKILNKTNDVKQMISLNLNDPDSRHLMIFVEGSFYTDTVVEAIRKHQMIKGFEKEQIIKGGEKEQIIKGVEKEQIKYLNNDKRPIPSLINYITGYVSDGNTVIMRNMDALYPSLYDLFNQRYTEIEGDTEQDKTENIQENIEQPKAENIQENIEQPEEDREVREARMSEGEMEDNSGYSDMADLKDDDSESQEKIEQINLPKNEGVKKKCQISHGNSILQTIVHPNFKCIILMDKPTDDELTDLKALEEKWPTPLLNRFEKHLLTQEDLLDRETSKKISACLKEFETDPVNPKQYIHNYSKTMIRSIVAVEHAKQAIEFHLIKPKEFAKAQVESRKHYEGQANYRVRGLPADMEEQNEPLQGSMVNQLLSLKPLYNINYIYYLHKKYALPSQAQERDFHFKEFLDSPSCQLSLASFIKEKMRASARQDGKPHAYVVFSLSQPYDVDVREILSQDAELLSVKYNLVEFTSFNSLTHRNERIAAVINDPCEVAIFQFKNSEEWRELEEYATLIEEIVTTAAAKESNRRKKVIVLLAHNCSYDLMESDKFKFLSIHFHSYFTPVGIDFIEGSKKIGQEGCRYRYCYDHMDKSLTDLMQNAPLVKSALLQSLKKVFPTLSMTSNQQTYTEFISGLVRMIEEEDLLTTLVIPLIKKNDGFLKAFTQDSRLQISLDKPIMEMIEVSQNLPLGNISEIITMLTSTLLSYVLQTAFRTIHFHYDLLYLLRCCDRCKILSLRDNEHQATNQVAETRDYIEMMQLWKTVAMKSDLSDHAINEGLKGRAAFSEEESKEYVQVFYRHVLKPGLMPDGYRVSLPKKVKFEIYKKLVQSTKTENFKDDRKKNFYNILKEDAIPRLKSQFQISEEFVAFFKQNVENREILKDLVEAFTDKKFMGTITYDHLRIFAEPLADFAKTKAKEVTSLEDYFYIMAAVIECLPSEVQTFGKLDDHENFELLLLDEIEEKMASLSAGHVLIQDTFNRLGKTDHENVGVFYKELKKRVKEGSRNPLKWAKLQVLSESLMATYNSIYYQKDELVTEDIIGSAVSDMEKLMEMLIPQRLENLDESGWSFYRKAFNLIVMLLSKSSIKDKHRVADQKEVDFMLVGKQTFTSDFKPEEDGSIKLKSKVRDTINLSEVVKIALFTGFLENKKEVEELFGNDPECNELLQKFLTVSKDQGESIWKSHFSNLLYQVDKEYPVHHIEQLLVNNIEPIGFSLEQRILNMRQSIIEEREKDKKSIFSATFPYPAKESGSLIKALESINNYLVVKKPSETLTKDVLKNLRELYREYGTVHSFYHFIEFVTIVLILITTDDKLNKDQSFKKIVDFLKKYRSGDDSLIFLLPFASIQIKTITDFSYEIQDKLMQEFNLDSNQKDLFNFTIAICNDGSLIAEGIIILRNLIVCVTSTLSMKKSEVKNTKLSYLLDAGSSDISGMKNSLAKLKQYLLTIKTQDIFDFDVEFAELTLFDLVNPLGKIWKFFDKILGLYNKRVADLGSILKVSDINKKSLIQVKHDDLLQLDKKELDRALSKRPVCLERDQEELCRVLRNELYNRLSSSVTLDINFEVMKFNYTDEYKDETMSLFEECQQLMAYSLGTIKADVFRPIFQVEDPSNLIVLEKILVIALKREISTGNMSGEKTLNLEYNINLQFTHFAAFLKMILMRKLQKIFETSDFNARFFPRHRLLIDLMKHSRDHNVQLALLGMLNQVAGGQFIDAIFKDYKKPGTDLIDGDILLTSIEDLRPSLNILAAKIKEALGFTIGDLILASYKLCSEFFV